MKGYIHSMIGLIFWVVCFMAVWAMGRHPRVFEVLMAYIAGWVMHSIWRAVGDDYR